MLPPQRQQFQNAFFQYMQPSCIQDDLEMLNFFCQFESESQFSYNISIQKFNNLSNRKKLFQVTSITFVFLPCVKANICQCPLKIIRDSVIEIILNPYYLCLK